MTEFIWLPRPDQTIALLAEDWLEAVAIFLRWFESPKPEYENDDGVPDSVDAALIECYMEHKHNKAWNGDEWE